MKGKNSFIKGAFFLALGAFGAKIIGALYRIPLTNFLGGFGLGLYQTVFPVYCVLLDFAGAGVPNALASIIAGDKENSAEKYLFSAIKLLSVIGLIGSAILFSCAFFLPSLQGAAEAKAGYMFLSPSVFLVALISCFRGYFQGKMNMLPTSLSQITEQIFKAGVGLFLVWIFKKNIPLAVGMAMLAISVSELAALVFLILLYKKQKKTEKSIKSETIVSANGAVIVNATETENQTINDTYAVCKTVNDTTTTDKTIKSSEKQMKTKSHGMTFKIIKCAFPVTLTGIFLPLTQFIDSFIVINVLSTYTGNATSLFGLFSGAALTVIGLPVSLCYGLAVTAVPFVAAKEKDKRKSGAIKAVLITLLFSVPFAVVIGIFPREITGFLFKTLTDGEKTITANLIKLMSANVVLLSVLQTVNGSLIGSGKYYSPLIGMGVGTALKISVTLGLLFIPEINIYGAGVGLIACYFSALLINFIMLVKVKEKNEVKTALVKKYQYQQ